MDFLNNIQKEELKIHILMSSFFDNRPDSIKYIKETDLVKPFYERIIIIFELRADLDETNIYYWMHDYSKLNENSTMNDYRKILLTISQFKKYSEDVIIQSNNELYNILKHLYQYEGFTKDNFDNMIHSLVYILFLKMYEDYVNKFTLDDNFINYSKEVLEIVNSNIINEKYYDRYFYKGIEYYLNIMEQ